ncbi:ABC transporter ATP-binding protein/permease [Clostridium chrysemydis]|uniref:ABC transporter ATP-binding protein/permease n=1 Tax=Clostridium chrysemydis TaxID=2665504 RepID=UPI0018833449|nr:ABC transporter ATP-binding protein/permease [Clostridium chrysemydis]
MFILRDIVKKFNGVKVIKNLNLEIEGGLNFIVGPSGSGKSTLLKIISGIDRDYEGEVFYRSKPIKRFKESQLDSYYYNSVGFIFQNFKLIDHLSVEDNVKAILELENIDKNEMNSRVDHILKRLALEKFAKKNVSLLSGGQKQRVAIARALVKEPEVIIADEPTGALDKKTSKMIMDVLKKIAKERTVIVVTHDKSAVTEDSNCFLLNNGVIEKINSAKKVQLSEEKKKIIKPNLSIKMAVVQGIKNFKGLFLKFLLTAFILMLASYFLLLNFSGTVANENSEILNKLILERGNNLRDLDLATSMMSGVSTKGEKGASLDIEQDVSKAFERLRNDPRIEFIIPVDGIQNMKVQLDGKEYDIENSNTVPIVNEVESGRVPNMSGREVAISKKFVENLNLKPEDVIGKTISIDGVAFDWSSGSPKEVKIKISDVKIVGVLNTKYTIDSPSYGKEEIELEDSFIYGLDVVKDIKKQSNSNTDNLSFRVRVKEIKDIMPIVNELEKDGLTPIGEFETVKDILKISDVSKDQTSSVSVILAAIAMIVTILITLINGYIRKGEFAILSINGYSKKSIAILNIMEYILISIVSAIMFALALPVINNISKSIFDMEIVGVNTRLLGAGIVISLGLLMGILSAIILSNLKTENNLMKGDR